MNRYIDGLKYPQRHPFREDSDRILDQFHIDTKVENGIVRWESNNNIPPREVLEFWNYANLPFNYEKSLKLLEEETNNFLSEYTINHTQPSEEELYEMRSAFGKNTEIVNVITGKKYKI